MHMCAGNRSFKWSFSRNSYQVKSFRSSVSAFICRRGKRRSCVSVSQVCTFSSDVASWLGWYCLKCKICFTVDVMVLMTGFIMGGSWFVPKRFLLTWGWQYRSSSRPQQTGDSQITYLTHSCLNWWSRNLQLFRNDLPSLCKSIILFFSLHWVPWTSGSIQWVFLNTCWEREITDCC